MLFSETLTPVIYNKTLTDADTEYSQVLPGSCRHFSVQARTAAVVRIAFEAGKVATPTAPYATIKAGGAYTSPEKLDAPTAGLTIYLGTPTATTVVEVIAWY